MPTIKLIGLPIEQDTDFGTVFEYEGNFFQNMGNGSAEFMCSKDDFAGWKTVNPDAPYPSIKIK